MKRRDFFRQAGFGSAALVSLPGLAHAFTGRAGDADDDGRRAGFFFTVNSQAGTVGGVSHRLQICGSGAFDLAEAEGGGSYNHIDFASVVPKTILSGGTWEAGEVLSFNPIGAYGTLAAGILNMRIRLHQEIPSRALIPATLKIACSIAAAGFDAGELEGVTVTIPGAPFGPFEPFFQADSVTSGVTTFTTSARARD